MSHREIQDRLDDYVDGLLTEDERREVGAHLERCEDCRGEVESLRLLLEAAAGLPRSMAPERDLWKNIADRIGGKKVVSADFGRAGSDRRSAWFTRGMLAAAAVVLVALSSAITAFLVREQPGVSVVTDGKRLIRTQTEFLAVEAMYSPAIEELSTILREQRGALAPETVSVIEENLRIIDEAIRTSRIALAVDPGNEELIRTVVAMYEEKVGLLQQATHLPTGS